MKLIVFHSPSIFDIGDKSSTLINKISFYRLLSFNTVRRSDKYFQILVEGLQESAEIMRGIKNYVD